ncbi:hypothetical protein Xen7305DRAFT_00012450 [Xenococcus sp. PCC 7305]|nr:hypothetical protein Xen7305DRAFT_00012450 [Xenococcus sp. PCC 7305]
MLNREPDTTVAIAQSVYRDDEQITVTSLEMKFIKN